MEAVTIDAVTKASKVARTTLYRHFQSSSHLLAATFERFGRLDALVNNSGGQFPQAAIDFIVKNQAADGSWGYTAGTSGDTSILGWQLQALKAASVSKDFAVPEKCVAGMSAFLDKVASGKSKSVCLGPGEAAYLARASFTSAGWIS